MLQQALSYLNEVKETITKLIITIDQFVEKKNQIVDICNEIQLPAAE